MIGEGSGVSSGQNPGTVCYLLDYFPVLSQTFIVNEILAVEDLGIQAEVAYLHRMPSSLRHEAASTLLDRAVNLSAWLGRRERWSNRWWLARRGRMRRVRHRTGQCVCGWDDRAVAERFARRALTVGAGQIHAHFAGDASRVAMWAAYISGLPFSFTMHGYDVFFKPPGDLHEQAERANVVVAVSEAIREHLIEKAGLGSGKVCVIRNGVDCGRFRASELCVGDSAIPTLLTVARLDPVKGLDILVEALGGLAGTGTSFRWLCVGEGPESARLERQVIRRGLSERVEFLGALTQEQLPEVYRRADLFVLPSRSEGLGVVLLEAMASGLPIVASSVGGIPEVVEDGIHGFLVKPEDPVALAEALGRLLDEPDLRAVMGRVNRERAVREFSVERQGMELMKVWGMTPPATKA